jgi:hypothetical protein
MTIDCAPPHEYPIGVSAGIAHTHSMFHIPCFLQVSRPSAKENANNGR